MSRAVVVSDHAAWRFIQRFAPQLSLREAHEQIAAAIAGASELPKAQRRQLEQKQYASAGGGKIVYWFCGARSAVFVTERERGTGCYRVLTCFPYSVGLPQFRMTRDTRRHRQRRKREEPREDPSA